MIKLKINPRNYFCYSKNLNKILIKKGIYNKIKFRKNSKFKKYNQTNKKFKILYNLILIIRS